MIYDKTKFLSGMAMGLTGKGDPISTINAADAFTKGYKTGAELRRKRTEGSNLTISASKGSVRKGSASLITTLLPNPVLHTNVWELKEWNKAFVAGDVWSDGNNIYLNNNNSSCVLKGDTWEEHVWNKTIIGSGVWTDGTKIYYNGNSESYVLNDNIWEEKVWNGLTNFSGADVWTDGRNIYYSRMAGGRATHYVLNGDTWEPKTWYGLTSFDKKHLWTDGNNIYYTSSDSNYILIGDTWVPKEWKGASILSYGSNIWTDGINVYYSGSDRKNCVLNGDTWEEITFVFEHSGFSIDAEQLWTDGSNIYMSNSYDYTQRVLPGCAVMVTNRTATVNFVCNNLQTSGFAYCIKAWVYEKTEGLDITLSPTWTSEAFTETKHSEAHTFKGLTPGTTYGVYAVIEANGTATTHNASTIFTTL